MKSVCEYSGYDFENNVTTCKIHGKCRYIVASEERCYQEHNEGPMTIKEPIKEKLEKFFKEKEMEYKMYFISSYFMMIEFNGFHLLLNLDESFVSTLVDRNSPEGKFVSELLEVISPENQVIRLTDGSTFTKSILLDGNEKIKDEFIFKKTTISTAKKRYSSIIKLQKERENNIKGFDKSKHDCDYYVEGIGHCMLNTHKADIHICDSPSKDSCEIYRKFGR